MKRISSIAAVLFVLASGTALTAACAKPDNSGDNTQKVAPTSLMLNNLTGDANGEEGEGTISAPYTVSVAAGKTSVHNMTVRPVGADAAFDWTVGVIEEETFTESQSPAITVSQTEVSLTIQTGEQLGDYYVKGEAQTGDFEVYLKVSVTEYVALESFTLNGFEKVEGQEYDYVFKTAKGSTWDLNKGMTRRGQDLLDGKIFGGNQAPKNLTYYSNLYKFEFTPVPANATNTAWVMTAADPAMFKAEGDGSWTAAKAGETIVTVTNGANEASVKIKIEVVDTLYTGILKSEYEDYAANTNLDWYFDGDADEKELTLSRLHAWNLVVNKTTAAVDGDDNNQKIFYLGDPARPYGIDLESRIDSKTGVTPGTTLALAWTKATIPAGSDKIFAVIGNNNKNINRYRIVMVEGNGTVYPVTDGWVDKEADPTGTPVSYAVPAACKGKDVAVVIESTLTKTGDNCEMHLKGVWITLPVSDVEFKTKAAEASQGSVYQLDVQLSPSKVIDASIEYMVTSAPQGGEGKISIDENGLATVAVDAPTGEYVIKAVSLANAHANDTFTLTVTGYNNLTGFTAKYTARNGQLTDLNGATFNEKQGAAGYVLSFGYLPENASVQDYTVTYSTENVARITTSENDAHEMITYLNFLVPGTTTVTVTPKAAEAAALAITFNVTVREGVVLNWDNKAAIIDEEKGWTVSGGWDSGVGEGADINGNNGGKLTYEVDLTEKDLATLTLGARTFVRPNETNSKMYVSVKLADGTETRVLASNYEYADGVDTILIDNSDPKFDQRNEFVFDLSAFADKGVVTITIGADAGTHCVITDIQLS